MKKNYKKAKIGTLIGLMSLGGVNGMKNQHTLAARIKMEMKVMRALVDTGMVHAFLMMVKNGLFGSLLIN